MKDASLDNYIIDDQAKGVFRVNRRVFTDADCLDTERQRIFESCWIYAGHESEVPKAGDFRSRRVAGRPLILVRGDDRDVRVLLNTCTHRGSLVCRQSSGNAKTFQCPYHAWTYNQRGELIGVPGDDSYSEAALDRKELALAQPARVDSYRGFIFVSFNPAAQDLDEYLAGAKEYLDLVCDQSEVGMKIVEGTQAYSIRANWKLLVENSIDGYHALPTHQRYFGYLRESGGIPSGYPRQPEQALDLGNGHAVIEFDAMFGRPIARWVPAFGELSKGRIEAKQRELEERFGNQRANRITQTGRNLLIFPNLIINDIMAITVRTFFPVAQDYMEVNAWSLAPVDETLEDSALRLDNFLTFLGPGGFATPDDVEMLESCQRGFANHEVGWSDISRGMQREHPAMSDELQLRTFWRRWNGLMTTPQARRARRAA